jgi:type I restriction enzyme S subunit
MGNQTKSVIDINPHYQEEILRILNIYIPDVEVRAFGSRVKWTAKPYSDLDLALMTQRPLSLDQEAQLREAFDESTLPFKVDFVDWASTSKNFQNIISSHSVLFRPASRHPSGDEWAVMPLEEALDALLDYRGKTPEKTSFGIPLITAKIVKNGRIEPATEFIAREKYAEWMTRGLPRTGDVLLTTEAPLGEVAQLHTDQVALAQRLVALRGKAGVLDNTYLCYLLQTGEMQEQLAARATGTTVLGIKQSELRKIPVRLPPLERQRAAAAILSSLDDRITLLRETNATLEAIAQALFKSWFVDFDPVRAKMEGRAPEGMDEATAALFPDALEESELGWVPKEWKPLTVSEVSEIVKGKSYSSKDLVAEHETALVTLKSFARGGGFRLDGFKPYAGTYKASQVVVSGDLIVAYTDVTQAAELIGKPAIVIGVDEYKTLVASLDVGIIRPLDTQVSRQFLFGLFNTDAFQAHTLSHTSETTVLHLSKDGVGSYKFVCPPLPVVNAFSVIAESLTSRQQVNIDQMRNLATLRDTLLPRLISGQLRLPEAQALVATA